MHGEIVSKNEHRISFSLGKLKYVTVVITVVYHKCSENSVGGCCCGKTSAKKANNMVSLIALCCIHSWIHRYANLMRLETYPIPRPTPFFSTYSPTTGALLMLYWLLTADLVNMRWVTFS